MKDLLSIQITSEISPVTLSYLIVFIVLVGSTFLTVLEVVYAQHFHTNPTYSYLQSALMIESAVNCIASYFYYYFLSKALTTPNVEDLAAFTEPLRSVDWLVTTPLMLSSLMYYYKYNHEACETFMYTSRRTPKYTYSVPIILGLVMLMVISGSDYVKVWAGSNLRSATYIGIFISWLCFGGIVYLIYENFYRQSKTKHKDLVSWWFLITWSCYGLVRHMELFSQKSYQITYNFLDLLSKGGFGVLLWVITQEIQAGGCIRRA